MAEYFADIKTPINIAHAVSAGARITVDLGKFWGAAGWPINNLWLGVTVCNQKEADEKIPILLQTPAAVRFVSIEPMLGPVDLSEFEEKEWICDGCGEFYSHQDDATCNHCGYAERHLGYRNKIDWVILGGESGPGARPLHPDWARSVRDQCKAAGVPFFFKQWGEWIDHSLTDIKPTKKNAKICFPDDTIIPYRIPDGPTYDKWKKWGGRTMIRVGRKKAGHLLDGKEIREYPK